MRLIYLICCLTLFSTLQAESSSNVLTVSGQGSTTIQATLASIQVGIETQHKNAKDVQEDLKVKLSAVLEKLKTLPAERLEVENMQIFPEYEKDRSTQLAGYKGRITVQFTSSVEQAGSLVDAALQAGANELSQMTIRPTEEAQHEANLKAIELACADAEEKAATVINALKLKGKGVYSVTVEPSSPAHFYRGNYMMAKAAPSLEVTPQEQTISATVQLQIRLE